MGIKLDITSALDDVGIWLKDMPKHSIKRAVQRTLKRAKAPLKRASFKRAKELRNVSNAVLNEKKRTSIKSFVGGNDIAKMNTTFRFSHRGIGLRNFQTKRNIGQTTVLRGRSAGHKGKKSGLPRRQKVKLRVTKRKRISLKNAWVGRAKGNLLVLQRKGAKVIALPPVYMNAVMRKDRAHEPILKELSPIVQKNLKNELNFRFKKSKGLISKRPKQV